MPAPRRRGFGSIRKLPSKRYQAHYTGPDLVRHLAPTTFDTREDAEAWLSRRRGEVNGGTWQPQQAPRKVTLFGDYADMWLAHRPLKPRTSAHYRKLIDGHLKPAFGALPVGSIDPVRVRSWHAGLPDTPTMNAHAYSLLRSILVTAVQDGLLASNPCHIRGASSSRRKHQPKPASLAELETITQAMPQRYRPMVLLAAWCALRFGELAELRRSDLDLSAGVLHVRRGVVRVDGDTIVGEPKSSAGARDVAVPPHLLPMLRDHVLGTVNGRDGLLFPAADGVSHMAPSTLYKVWYPARAAAGRSDLRFHDLRHTGATMAAQAGGTLAELMSRLGHSSPAAAMRYQHSAAGRDAKIAAVLSQMAAQGVDTATSGH